MAYNIIFYFSDQQRWDTCGCYGQPLNITPNLDALAKEGVKFEMHFLPSRCAAPAGLYSRPEGTQRKQGVSATILCFHQE